MNPKDLFQTALRVAGASLRYFSIPRAPSDRLSLPDTFHVQSPGWILGAIFRIFWETAIALWLLAGAPRLTQRLYASA